MNSEMKAKLEKYMQADGTYALDQISWRYDQESEPRKFHVGDVVEISAGEDASLHIKQALPSPVLAKVIRVFQVRSNKADVMIWCYDVATPEGKTFAVGNVEAKKVDAQLEIPSYFTLTDFTNEMVTREEYLAAREHNQAVEATRQEAQEAEAQAILAKSDDEISDAEWQKLMEMGYATTYIIQSPWDDMGQDTTGYRRTSKRPAPELFTRESEESLAKRGL